MVPLHLGPVHPVEQALTLLLAFGPFAVLGIVVYLRRRADEREQAVGVAEPDRPDRPDRPDQPERPER